MSCIGLSLFQPFPMALLAMLPNFHLHRPPGPDDKTALRVIKRQLHGDFEDFFFVAGCVPEANNLKDNEFSMELIGPESGFAPKHYGMDKSEVVPMCAFSESTQGKISYEGNILKLDMRPLHENMENYGKLCRERTKKYTTKSRQIQVIDNDTGSHMRPMPGMMIPLGFTEKKKAPAKASEVKRTRRDRGEMEDIMFKLFERQSNWTLRQLIQETDQPEQFLKDILKELCVYNNKGD
ncbi:uncharacterized protein LOC116138254 [Pistacia vera]|uniref:uncharacterized protein LOC116138254 n=1 Tax=Pistacia vera TaxID=55513 RepID=UPI001263706A|nr:uncharacterized protein LOC116138254 [Pistacia vera]